MTCSVEVKTWNPKKIIRTYEPLSVHLSEKRWPKVPVYFSCSSNFCAYPIPNYHLYRERLNCISGYYSNMLQAVESFKKSYSISQPSESCCSLIPWVVFFTDENSGRKEVSMKGKTKSTWLFWRKETAHGICYRKETRDTKTEAPKSRPEW